MHPLRQISRQNIQHNYLKLKNTTIQQPPHKLIHSKIQNFDQNPDEKSALRVQNILKHKKDNSFTSISRALELTHLTLTDSFALKVIELHSLDWKPCYVFFQWVLKTGEYSPGSLVFNAVLDVLGKSRRFEEVGEVIDEMCKRGGVFDEGSYGVLINRYAAAHRVEDAVGVFLRRREFGLRDEADGFRRLLMWLCRYKHVEVAEGLFVSRKDEFGEDVKCWNLVLNGWCVLGNVYEAKRVWKDMMAEGKCKPDLFTYGTFINALTKKGKLGTALKLFRMMWEKGRKPDVVICNCVINALCFKKRIPEALEVLKEMQERGVAPNVVTYNTLIKYMCKIRRMEKVYEILDGMEEKEGCMPNAITYGYLLRSLKNPDELPGILEKMERNGCEFTSDLYNLILKLYMKWDCREKVKSVWDEMERMRLGPDHRSYAIMIHGLHDRGGIEEALRYFHEMMSKGLIPEPRTTLLVNDMNRMLKESRGIPREVEIVGTKNS